MGLSIILCLALQGGKAPPAVLSDPRFVEALKAFVAAPEDPERRAKLDEVLAAHASDPVGWLAVGQEFFQQRDYPRALQFLGYAAERFPKDARPHYFSGLCWFVQEKYDLAEAELRIALVRAPADSEVIFNLAQALGQQRKIDEAERLYREAAELAPDRSLFHFSLGEALMHVTKIDEAISEFRRAAELAKSRKRPEDATIRGRALHHLGKLLGMQDKHDEAKAQFESALRELPNDAEAHAQYGIYLYRRKQYSEALKLLTHAVELAPRHRQATYHLALCLKQLGQSAQSETYMKRFRELQTKFEDTEREAILQRMRENLGELQEPQAAAPKKDGGR